MKKSTSKKLNKRMASYGALAVAITGASDVMGQINYTDVDPDEVLSGTRFLLDLNGDGTTDYEISNDGTFSGVTPGTTARVYTSNSQSILGQNFGGNYNYPFALDAGILLDDTSPDWITDPNYQTLNWQGCAYTNSQWCDGQVDKYLGLRINVGGEQHYGWIRMDIPADASSITIKDYAFNTVAGEGIETGDQGLGLNDNAFEGFAYFMDENSNLNLKAATTIENVSVFNVLGQNVANKELNATSGLVALDGMTTGVYIATVTIEGQKQSFKVIKK